MKQAVKMIVFSMVRALAPKETRGAVILMYHSISDSEAFFAVPPGDFERQIGYLADSGRTCVSFSELMRRFYARETLDGLACVTFDDGYRDNRVIALPILQRYSIPASVFVSTGLMGTVRTTSKGDQLEVMDGPMLADLISGGLVECMPHGHMHERLSLLDDSLAATEITASRNAIELITGEPSIYFAYPFGDYSEKTLAILDSLGFKGALTVEEGIAAPDSKPLEMPRMAMTRETSFGEFICKVSRPKAYLFVMRMLGKKRPF